VLHAEKRLSSGMKAFYISAEPLTSLVLFAQQPECLIVCPARMTNYCARGRDTAFREDGIWNLLIPGVRTDRLAAKAGAVS
jgi:hypothetical protein